MRQVNKPAVFKDRSTWETFKFQATNYLCFMDKEYITELESSRLSKVELGLDDFGEDTVSRSVNLYAMLTSWTQDMPVCMTLGRSIRDSLRPSAKA